MVEERQGSVKIQLATSESMATDMSTRVQIEREIDPGFTRNDLIRRAYLEYMTRHPIPAAKLAALRAGAVRRP